MIASFLSDVSQVFELGAEMWVVYEYIIVRFMFVCKIVVEKQIIKNINYNEFFYACKQVVRSASFKMLVRHIWRTICSHSCTGPVKQIQEWETRNFLVDDFPTTIYLTLKWLDQRAGAERNEYCKKCISRDPIFELYYILL